MTPMDVLLQAPYHAFYLLGLALGGWLAVRAGRRASLPVNEWVALLAFTAAVAIVGSKLLHFDLAAPSPGGKTILGGVLAGAVALLVGARALRLDPRAPDALALALPLGFATGRIGCLLAGCCFGHVTDGPWGVAYGPGTQPFRAQVAAGLIEANAAAALPVHAVQLYEALFALAVAALVARTRVRLRAPGSAVLATLALLAAGRVLLEVLRVRDAAPVAGLTVVQWLLVLATAVCALRLVAGEVRVRRNAPAPAPADPPRPHALLAWSMFALPAALLLTGTFFTPLERLALAGFAVPGILAAAGAAWRRSAASRPLLVSGFATAAVVIVPLQQDTTRFPRSHWTLGIGSAVARTTDSRQVLLGYGEDCNGNYGPQYGYTEMRMDHVVGGAGLRHTRELSDTRSQTLGAGVMIARTRSLPQDSLGMNRLGEQTTTARAASFTSGWAGRNFGATLGGGIGRFGADTTTSVLLIAAARVGAAAGLHAVGAVNDLEPVGPYASMYRLGVGHGLGSLGSRVEAGLWGRSTYEGGTGAYVTGTLVTAAGLEIQPFAGFAREHDVRITLRRRIGAR